MENILAAYTPGVLYKDIVLPYVIKDGPILYTLNTYPA